MKSIRVRQILTLVALLFTAGCASIKLQSNKAAPPGEPFDRLSIVINHGDSEKQPYSHLLAEALRVALTNSPVTIDLSISSPLELDESVHQKQIQAFEPDAVLVITATGGVVGEYGGYPTILYDASLFDTPLTNRLWRAHINNTGGTAMMRKRMTEMAQQIVSQLQADRFLAR
jgi:hypothetical protein